MKAIEGRQHDFESTSASKNSTLLPGCLSFKVITESVLFFMRLLSSPDSEGQRDMVSKIVPLIVKAVGFQCPDSSSDLRTSNCPSSKLQQILTELKMGQAKALMTLMVLMKVHPEAVRPHARDIANNIVKSLESCPSHVTEIRRVSHQSFHELKKLSYINQSWLMPHKNIWTRMSWRTLWSHLKVAFKLLKYTE